MRFKLKIIGHLLRLKWYRWRYRGKNAQLHARLWGKLHLHLQKSPYYRKYTSEENELPQFPVIQKSAFMLHFDEINTVGIKKENAFALALEAERSRNFSPVINGITIGLSSGTSGNRGIFMASETERAQWVAAVLDRVIGFSLRKRKVAFFLRANSNLYESAKSKILEFNFFDLLIPAKDHIEKLNRLQPDILIGQPSLLLELAAYQSEKILTINPDKIISVAEVLTEEDKNKISSVFGKMVHQVYQCTEGFLASSCKYGTLHFNEDFLIIEKKYIDENKERFHPVITDLLRRSQPVIRYELNDLIIGMKKCPCGNPHLAIAKIEGRSDDVLHFRTSDGTAVSVFPDYFRRAVLLADASISDYMIVQKSDRLLEVYMNRSENQIRKNVEAEINKLLQFYQINAPEIVFLEQKPFQRGEKLRRIKNECK